MMHGNKYIIKYLGVVVKEDIPNLQSTIKTMIKRAIEERLMIDPVRVWQTIAIQPQGASSLKSQ